MKYIITETAEYEVEASNEEEAMEIFLDEGPETSLRCTVLERKIHLDPSANIDDWQQEVANGDTVLGFVEWVASISGATA